MDKLCACKSHNKLMNFRCWSENWTTDRKRQTMLRDRTGLTYRNPGLKAGIDNKSLVSAPPRVYRGPFPSLAQIPSTQFYYIHHTNNLICMIMRKNPRLSGPVWDRSVVERVNLLMATDWRALRNGVNKVKIYFFRLQLIHFRQHQMHYVHVLLWPMIP